jgi:hypothetical protein
MTRPRNHTPAELRKNAIAAAALIGAVMLGALLCQLVLR